MLSISYLTLSSFLLLLVDRSEQLTCPKYYNMIVAGCYKVNNGSNMTWPAAQQYCNDDLINSTSNLTNGITHLAALEIAMEKTAVLHWLAAYQIPQPFWIDGLASTLKWNWSNQSINWYLNSTESAIVGNGSNYKIQYNANVSHYQIADDVGSHSIPYLCEYQELCDANNSCLNDATCYLNLGFELCLCAPGFDGDQCEININDCLSSPCQHGGQCTDGINNVTCNCSQTFFTGWRCETALPDPTAGDRSAAFWSVVGVVCGMILLLTVSDLPWTSILSAMGCRCQCCSDHNDRKQIEKIATHLSHSPGADPGEAAGKGMNYHVRTAFWAPEHAKAGTPVKTEYDGYHSPPIHTNVHVVPEAAGKDSVDTMVGWTRHLQEQLRNKSPGATSSNSVRPLISPN